MKDIAHSVIHRSLKVKKADKIYVFCLGETPLLTNLLSSIRQVGAHAYIKEIKLSEWTALINSGDSSFYRNMFKYEAKIIRHVNGFIGVTQDSNLFEMNTVNQVNLKAFYKFFYEPLMNFAQETNKWILLNPPSKALSQLSKQSTNKLNTLFRHSVLMFNYEEFKREAKWLMDLLKSTNEVSIITHNTNLKFSIKGINPTICDGTHNLPGGEVFIAPVLDSVNGYITFNVPFHSFGVTFDYVKLEYEKGELISFDSSNNTKLKDILDSDEGAKYFGEFGIGLNPHINRPIFTSAYDEKMKGSVHLALGQSYKTSYNFNNSTVHMDLVLSMLKKDGRGRMYFDNNLVMKDGEFLPHLV
ncbi:aminopeptidase [Bacillus sp. SM2101]|uniref:aminopeptidase n=1 Tax=Bacillus sp. SM2101 TaxID=2805366 RepID=UPI001BDF1CEB|nr:aminopeptidase [Bacillus sp. SM2101]